MALADRIRSIRPKAIFAPQGDQAGFSQSPTSAIQPLKIAK